MKVMLIRHGETDWNKANKVQGGNTDLPLNENGIVQAEKTAERLKNEKIDEIYASPMKRALQTAEIIGKYHKIKIKSDKRLWERYYGDLEGTSYSQLMANVS